MRSRKGNYIVEAAVVLPVVVLAVLTVMLMIMFFYHQMQQRCEMHIALRAQAGMITEKNVYLDPGNWQGDMRSDRNTFGGTVYGKDYVFMNNRGLLKNSPRGEIEGEAHGVDGPRYARYCMLVKGMLWDEEQ